MESRTDQSIIGHIRATPMTRYKLASTTELQGCYYATRITAISRIYRYVRMASFPEQSFRGNFRLPYTFALLVFGRQTGSTHIVCSNLRSFLFGVANFVARNF